MFRILVLLTAVAAFAPLAAQPDAQPRAVQLLNSERIEQRFGSYGIEVLASDAELRVSNLYSTEPDGWICRTFAVVRYPAEVAPAFAAEHAEILAGGSIGAVFAARGWSVERRHRWLGEVPATERVRALMGGIAPTPLAIHVFELIVTRDQRSFRYALIAEVHHPDHLGLGELREIFGAAFAGTGDGDTAAAMLAVTLEAMR
jgi:hypothetical protein